MHLNFISRFALTCFVNVCCSRYDMIHPPPPRPPPTSPPLLPRPRPPHLPPTPSGIYACRGHSLKVTGDPTSGDWKPCILYPCSQLSAALLLSLIHI